MMNQMMDIRVTVNQAIPVINVKKVILLENTLRYSKHYSIFHEWALKRSNFIKIYYNRG